MLSNIFKEISRIKNFQQKDNFEINTDTTFYIIILYFQASNILGYTSQPQISIEYSLYRILVKCKLGNPE